LTIAATRTQEFSIGKICTMAYRSAALLSPYMSMTEQQSSAAIDFLGIIIRSPDAEGMFARQVEFQNITLISGTHIYALDESVLDVIGAAMYISPEHTDITQADSELYVRQISRETWHELGTKSTAGSPTMFYLHRTGVSPEVRLWPVPSDSEDGGTVRFQAQLLRADVTVATNTVDFERYWTDYLVKKLGAELARSNAVNLGRVGELEAQAHASLIKCRGKSNEGLPQQFVLMHGNGYGGRSS
jgi:hypothetical protein